SSGLVHPLTVTVTEYVPDAVVVAEVIVGFCADDVNPVGPVHEYVAPATAAVERFKADPAQTGPLFVGAGVAGIAFTTALTVPAGLVHPFTVTVTEYVPDAAVVGEAIVGFCADDVNPLGPVHEYVAPATAAVKRFNADPAQTGPLLVGAGVAGIAFTTALTVPAGLVHPFTVTVTEYVPDAVVVAEAIVGFCADDVNPLGPVHEYVAPATAAVERFNADPAQTGPLLVGAGVAGIAFTTALTVPAGLVAPFTVT